MEIATIGFTRSSAESFFGRLRDARASALIDIRLNRRSQLAAFARESDLPYFAQALAGLRYEVHELLAPPADDLRAYRARELSWEDYAERYLLTLADRRAESVLDRATFERGVVLLCSEATADLCHRRLAAEYLAAAWGGATITHL